MEDLFGNTVEVKSKKQVDFEDYEAFVSKFEAKKTTDDCYTPPEVYDAVLDYVRTKVDISDKRIIRPFVPNGDYKSIDYKEGDVVIDNPPFSILAQIIRFYTEHNVPFFLFAPALTLFSSTKELCTSIVCGATIVYENGAKVCTSFATNMYGDGDVIVDGELFRILDDVCYRMRAKRRKVLKGKIYPDTIVSSALLQKISQRGVSLTIPAAERRFISKLDCGIRIFGSGFIISDIAAAERVAAERAAAERAVVERVVAEGAAAERVAAERAAAERAQLSPREIDIIKNLSRL